MKVIELDRKFSHGSYVGGKWFENNSLFLEVYCQLGGRKIKVHIGNGSLICDYSLYKWNKSYESD